MKLINDKLSESYAKIDSLRKVLEINKYRSGFIELKSHLDSAYIDIRMKHREFILKFIENHLSSLVSIIAIYQDFGSSHVFSERKDFALFEKLSKSIIAAYPTNSHSMGFNNSVEKMRKKIEEEDNIEKSLNVGAMAPEIQLPDTNKVMFSLSSLKGNVVLIDFWASFHAPCRVQNKLLTTLYGKYKKKGFEIVSVSVDKSEPEWKATIRKDKMSWIQLNDFMNFNSPTLKKYNITAIPYLILINRKGEIVSKAPQLNELDKSNHQIFFQLI